MVDSLSFSFFFSEWMESKFFMVVEFIKYHLFLSLYFFTIKINGSFDCTALSKVVFLVNWNARI